MIRAYRALAWMRFRLFVNSMMRTGRRDTLEQMSRALASVLPVALAIGLVPSAIVFGIAGYFGGKLIAAGHQATPWIFTGTRIGFAALMLAVLMVPMIRGHGGGPGGLTRLSLLPIPRRVLFASELTSGLTDPWLALAIPLLLGVPVGLVAGGAPGTAAVALIAALLVMGSLTALGAVAAMGMASLFRDRRRGEWLTLIGAAVISVVPLLLTAVEPDRDKAAASPAARNVEAVGGTVLQVLPGGSYTAGVEAALAGSAGGVLAAGAGLLIWTGLLTFVAARLHRRLLETPGESARGAARSAARLESRRLPGLNDAASAVALMTWTATLRTVRGKLGVYLNVLILGALLAMFRSQPKLQFPEGSLLTLGQAGAAAGLMLSVLSMTPVTLNLFASDRESLVRLRLAPMATRDLVLGKLWATTALTTVAVLLCGLLAAVLAPGGALSGWLALVLVYVAGQLMMAPSFALLSAVFPRHADLGRLGKPGNPHGLAGVAGFLLALLTMGPPAVAAAIALWLGRPWLGIVLPAAWVAVAAGLWFPLVKAAVATLERRSDNVLLVALGR